MNKKLYSPLGRLLGLFYLVAAIIVSRISFAMPELLLEYGPDGPVVKGVTISASDLDPSLNHERMGLSKMGYEVSLTHEGNWAGLTSTFHCYELGQTEVPARTYKNTENPYVKQRYEEHLTRYVGECSKWRPRGEIHNLPISSWTLKVMDGFYDSNKSVWWWDKMPLNTPDSACTTTVTDTIDFGNISPNSQDLSVSGSLTIVCNMNASVTVKVNGNSNLTSVDGSIISFDRVKKLAVMAETPTLIPIRSTMINGPKSPGSYMWFAPVIVSYD